MPYFNNSSVVSTDGWQLKDTVLTEFINSLKQQTASCMASDAPLWERHNKYTLYCISLFMFAMGHRPVRDPIESPLQILTEQSLALINDKVTHEQRDWRLVPLANIAQEQFLAYKNHLISVRNTSLALPKNGKYLAAEIDLLINKQTSALPYFFLLKPDLRTRSIKPKNIAEHWHPFAPLSTTQGRHTLASALGAGAIEPSYTLALMGHAVALDHWCGRNSELTPLTVMHALSEDIETSMKAIGWEALDGLRKYNTHAHKTLKQPTQPLHESNQLGIALRAAEREKSRNKEQASIQKVADAIFGSSPDRIDKSQLQRGFDAVKAAADDNSESASGALTCLISILHNHKRSGVAVEPFKWTLPISGEPSPFEATTLKNYEHFLSLQSKWRSLLRASHKSDVFSNPETRIAALILTIALEETYVEKAVLTGLCEFSNCRVFLSAETLHVEIYNSENNWLTRWFPSALAQPLLIGCLKNRAQCPPKLVTKALKSLLVKLGMPQSKNTDPVTQLWHVYQSRALIHLPGYERELVKQGRAHVPPRVVVRMLSSDPLKPTNTEKTETEPEDIWLPMLPPRVTNKPHVAIKKNLQQIFALLNADTDAGKIHGNRTINARLATELKALSKQRQDAPEISHLVLAWGVYLCVHGTRKKRHPALGTLQTYIPLISNALAAVVGNDSFLNYSEAEYGEAYLDAIGLGSQKDQTRLIIQLQHFHDFLVAHFCVEETEWADAWATARIAKTRVSANIVTYLEYERALDAINSDNSLSPQNRAQYQALIIFQYRFGLRFGEAYRLQARHLQFTSDYSDIIIRVTNSVFGTAKTSAGIRNVYSVEPLTVREINTLRLCIESAEAATIDDKQAGLMAQQTSRRELLDRGLLSHYLNRLLKAVSGDTTLHMHHFRHGFATRAYAALTPHSNHPFDWGQHTINTDCFREANFPEPLKCLSQVLGHSELLTTAHHYIHAWTNSQRNEPSPHELFNDKNIAAMMAVDYNTFAQRKKRNATLKPVNFELKKLKLAAITSGLTVSYAPIEAQSTESNFDQPLTPAKIESIFYRIIMRSSTAKRLAGFYGQSEANFTALLQTAEQLERMTGIDEHRFFIQVDDERYATSLSPTAENKRHHAEHLRLQHWLNEFETVLTGMSDSGHMRLEHLLYRWQQIIVPHTMRVAAISQSDLDDFIELLIILALLPTHISFNAPRKVTQLNTNKLDALGVTHDYTTRHHAPRAKEKSLQRRLTGLGMDLKSLPHIIGNQRTLYRALFILSVWCQQKKRVRH